VGALFASTGLYGPAGLAFDSAGYLYAANHDNNTIERFDPSGAGTLFANTGMDQPIFLAFQPVPEPSTAALLAGGLAALLLIRRQRCGRRHA